MTGTAKQAVANNYNSRLFRGMQANNNVFAEAVEDLVSAMVPGLQPGAMGWEWCFRENSTYLDCPVSEYDDSTNIMVAVFNPATNGPTDYITFPLKHGHYSVSVFNKT